MTLEITAKDGLVEKASPLDIIRRGGGKTKEKLHPVGCLPETGAAFTGKFRGEARTEDLEVRLGPMSGHRLVMMKVKSLCGSRLKSKVPKNVGDFC